MTDDQKAHLRVLAEQAGENQNESLSRGEADQRIDELQRKAGVKP